MIEELSLALHKRVQHRFFLNLVGTVVAVDNDNSSKPFVVKWDEPWLAASLLETFGLLFFSEDELELYNVPEEKKMKNKKCPECSGKGFSKRTLCYICAGSGVIVDKS